MGVSLSRTAREAALVFSHAFDTVTSQAYILVALFLFLSSRIWHRRCYVRDVAAMNRQYMLLLKAVNECHPSRARARNQHGSLICISSR